MEFAIGDQVMHPSHGLGEITAIKHVELVEGFEHYYEISIPEESLQLNIPMRSMEKLGVRPIMKAKKLEKVLAFLSGTPEALEDHYRSRQAEVEKQLRSGDPLEWAAVVRDLNWRKLADSITRRDSQLLGDAIDLLAAEISATLEISLNEAKSTIESTLALQDPPAQSA